MNASSLGLIVALALITGLAVGILIGSRVLRRDEASASDHLGLATSATANAVAPVKESLDRFDHRLRDLEASRIQWHSQLREQVEAVRLTGEGLRKETSSLATALRKPQVRGQWGEMHLKRTAELAGMVDRCDFNLQVSVRDGDNLLRPDMIVQLAGDKQVVVDSKVPLDAYLDAAQSETDDEYQAHLARHVRQVKTHIDSLAAKSYWKQFDQAPEFVVLFVPVESFLSQALEAEPTLLEYAAQKKVVLATPTTLIALLRTVAYAWSQEKLAANAREVQSLARELYERIGTVSTHLESLGKSLVSSVANYNKTVASIESRVLVTARKFNEFEIGSEPINDPRFVEETARALTAPELTEGLTS
ncbi:MAG: DNA recombination protein RmuC [Propionibacteriales bacterium]|nr:DNA recombination protein RmuC [Propionibacteriales bacterium]